MIYHVMSIDVCLADNNYISPQVEHMGESYDWDAQDSITKIRSNIPLVTPPNMRSFHLREETFLTDAISQSYIYTMGLLVSDQFCKKLEGFVIQEHEIYPAQVVYRHQAHNFFWIHIIEEFESRIDYARCSFLIRRADGIEDDVAIESVKSFFDTAMLFAKTGMGVLTAHEIHFLPGTPHYDLFCLRLRGATFFVSDALCEKLTGNRLTGFACAPSNTKMVFE